MPYTPRILYQVIAAPVLTTAQFPERVSEDKWHQPWSEPVRFKPALHPALHQFLAAPPAVVVPFSWFNNLSEPVRRRDFHVSLNQWERMQPNPIISIGWFQGLSEPVRRRDFQVSLNQWEMMQPTPIINIGWYNWLNEPVRKLPALGVENQIAFFMQPGPVVPSMASWWMPLTEPVRFKVLPTANIDFPTQILPTVPYTFGNFIPLYYQQPVGSLANSGIWRGRGLQT